MPAPPPWPRQGRDGPSRPVSASGAVTDLLFASYGVEPEIVEGADRIRAPPDLVLPVATVGHLIAMKLRPEMTGADPSALTTCGRSPRWPASATRRWPPRRSRLVRSSGYDGDVGPVGGLAALRGRPG